MRSIHIAILAFALFISNSCLGHNLDETFSAISVQDGRMVIQLELPWSVRDAVLDRFPEVKGTSSIDFFREKARQYIAENIEVSKNGQVISPTFLGLGDGSHSHSISVELHYPETYLEALSIRNTLLFNYTSLQQNHHQLLFPDGNTRRFVTNPKNPEFRANGKGDHKLLANTEVKYSALMVLIIAIGAVIIRQLDSAGFFNRQSKKQTQSVKSA